MLTALGSSFDRGPTPVHPDWVILLDRLAPFMAVLFAVQ